MKSVNVLLSTYNGGPFLGELLDSVHGQTWKNLALHARDDGSGDDTVSILKTGYDRGRIHRLVAGQNRGVVASFWALLENASPDSHFFAFADQDDIWQPDKIERAATALETVADDVPALYCSRLRYVDSHGVFIGYSPLPRRGLSMQNALVQNMAPGCTIVMNRPARSLLLSCLPARCMIHDWWCYLVLSAFGRTVYDEHPAIDYRLHDRNSIGAPTSLMETLRVRLRRFHREGTHAFKSHAQAVEFLQCFGRRLPAGRRRTVEAFIRSKQSPATRCRYAVRKAVYRHSLMDDLLLRLLIGWGRY